MMSYHLILGLAVLAGFIGFLLGMFRSWRGLQFGVFLLPYDAGGTPALGFVRIHTFYLLGYGIGHIFSGARYGAKRALRGSTGFWLGLVLLISVISLVISIESGKYTSLTINGGQPIRLMPSVLLYWTSLLAGVLLLTVVGREARDYQKVLSLIWAFSLSIFYMAFTYVASFLLEINLGPFLNTVYSGSSRVNFSGYNGESGLVAEYCLVVIGAFFAMLLSERVGHGRRILSIFGILLSIAIIVSTTSRSGLIGLAVLLAGLAVLVRKEPAIKASKKLLAATLTVLIVVAASTLVIGHAHVSEKVVTSSENLKKVREGKDVGSAIDTLLDRPYLSWGGKIVSESGLFGFGTMFGPELRANPFVSHSLYIGLPAKVGWLGALVYLCFYVSIFKGLWRAFGVMRKTRSTAANNRVAGSTGIRLALGIVGLTLIAIFLNEGFHFYENQTSSMMIFWFLLALAASAPHWSGAYVRTPRGAIT